MDKYRITFRATADRPEYTEYVEAYQFTVDGDWINFTSTPLEGSKSIRMVRSALVERVDLASAVL